ncbi:MAG: ASPIC/UnbV domain-containing protein, partial [Candidatus Poribacteria bacterium]|nr:ASPIC/UnbV domain-containing protein [Candidatus Poribacteria bacterium]
FGDYDNDGDLDIAVTQSNGPAHLLRNDGGNRRNWLRIKLVGAKSNRDGIGTRIRLTVGDESWMHEVHAGYSYLCSNDPRVLLGLGDVGTVDRLEIRWLSGTVQVLENIPANQEITIVEEDSEK